MTSHPDEPITPSIPAKKMNLSLAWITNLVFFVVMVAGSFYHYYAYQQLRQSMTTTITKTIAPFSLQLQALKQEQMETRAEFDATKITLDQLHEKLGNLDTALANRLREPTHKTDNWPLLKARYLLELAQLNAHWTDDSKTSIAILKEADELLSTLQTDRVFTIRQGLSKDIAALENKPVLDTPSLLSQLDAAQASIMALPLKHHSQKPSAPAKAPSASTWRERLDNSLKVLQQLVIIRHDADPRQLGLGPTQSSLLYESVILSLQETQWALLQRNEPLYKLTLSHTKAMIQRYFDTHSSTTQQLLSHLKTWEALTITPTKTEFGQSLMQLNQLILSEEHTS